MICSNNETVARHRDIVMRPEGSSSRLLVPYINCGGAERGQR